MELKQKHTAQKPNPKQTYKDEHNTRDPPITYKAYQVCQCIEEHPFKYVSNMCDTTWTPIEKNSDKNYLHGQFGF